MIAIDQRSENEILSNDFFYNRQKSLGAIVLNDELSFNKLVTTYSTKLFSTTLYITKDRQAAEDIVQEAFLELWEKRTEIHSNVGGWLYAVARKLAYKHLKRESYKMQLNASLNITKQNFYTEVEERLVHKESIAILENVRKRLPKKQQEIYRLSREEGLSRNEISERLNISSNTVKVHLLRAVQFIKEHIGAACLFFTFFAFNNIFLKSSNTKTNLKELYKVNRMSDKSFAEKAANHFINSSSISLIKVSLMRSMPET